VSETFMNKASISEDATERVTMTGAEFIDRFERGAVAADSFHHADHVCLAFAYLSRYPALVALERFVAALKSFAAALGKPDRYHETVTHAYFFLIRERIARSGATDWEAFARDNPDLLVWKDGILCRYYNQKTLESDLARRIFVFPDKSNFNLDKPSLSPDKSTPCV
jgi:hypothetical protein